jgi:GGDEF domain-containing protein
MNERVSASEIYSHDGIKDSLTHLAAPPYFYENLRREIASSARSGRPLSVIKFIVQSNGTSYEDSILQFADLLSRNFREEDLLARMGLFEFMLLIRENESVAEQMSQRFISYWALNGSKTLTPGYALVTDGHKEGALALLERLDLCSLITPKF